MTIYRVYSFDNTDSRFKSDVLDKSNAKIIYNLSLITVKRNT
jgi:hypothetical protein